MNVTPKIRILHGTRSESQTLCRTCSHVTIIRGGAESQERIFCGILTKELPFAVVECTDYEDKRQPSLYEMRNTAFYLVISKEKHAPGFISAKNFQELRDDREDE